MNFNFRSSVARICCLTAVVSLNRVILSLMALCFVVTGDSAGAAAASLASSSESSSRPEEEIHLRYRIEEEVPRGTIVGNVVNDANLRSRYSNVALQQIRFRFLAESSPAGGAAIAAVSSSGGGGAGGAGAVLSGGGTPSIAPTGLFEIGPSSGIIRTASDLDRDSPSMCRQRRLCELNIDVVTQPVQYFRILKVTVEIVDINDNSPRFRDSEIFLSINEAAQPGSLYPLPTAIDWDSPDQNSVQRYELDSPSPLADKFTLHVGTKLDGSAEVKLHLRDRLDREATAEYRLRLVAYDGGSKSGAATLVISVADSNDNRPEFVSGGTSGGSGSVQYEFTIVENLPIGSVVGRVQATDRDAGANGLVFYEIVGVPSGGSSSGHQGRPSPSSTASSSTMPFFVRNTTGEIVVRGTIDRETAGIHRFTIVARDNGPDQLSAEASIVVHVDDLNDNAPAVTIHTLVASPPSSGSSPSSSSTSVIVAEISEDSPIGSFVAYVSATDPDEGSNGRVDCELVHAGSSSSGGGGAGGGGSSSSSVDAASSTFSLTQKYENEYQIVTSGPLDRERRAEYAVAVRCRDNGTPSARIGEKTVRIVVTDVNDNPPVFSQQTYRGSIVENNVIGISVLQVTATDWDSGDNGRVQYSIPGTVSQMFHIDQLGVISIHSVVDRERYDSFRFPILAVDRGSSPSALTGSALVVINVEDVDDERPKFLQPHYVFGVFENEPPGTEVGGVLAEDRDGPPYNYFRYAYQSGDPSSEESFAVDAASGTISLRLPLDRERRPQYRFVIVAYDPKSYISLSLQPSSTATVTVNVLDRNDNAPFFVSPPANVTSTVQVSGHAPIGHVVSTASARDFDIDDNGRIVYSLRRSVIGTGNGDVNGGVRFVDTGSDTTGLFRIDAATGAIVVDSALLAVSGSTFPVVVVATDAGVPPLSTSTTINVCVNRSLPFVFSEVDGGSGSMMTASSYGHNSRMTTFNLVLVVAIVCGCSVVVFVLIVAIALVRHRDFRRRHARKYNCRMEALRMITSGDPSGSKELPQDATTTIGVTVTSPGGTPSKRISNGSVVTSFNPELSTSIRHLASEPSGSVGYHSSTSVNEQMNHGNATSSKFSTGNGNISADSGADQDSVHSVEGDGSVTDSGRGPSEEGEGVNALAATSSLSAIGVPGSYATAGTIATKPQRERAVPPPPPPPRPGAAYWALHHQNQPQQPAILVGGHYLHHHRGPPQTYPTVRFHGLSTTIPEDEMLGDCGTALDDGVASSEKQFTSSLSLSSVTTSGRSARQPGRRAASGSATAPAGTRANYISRLPGQHSARVHTGTTPSGGGASGGGGGESEAQALLHGGRMTTSGQNECDARSPEPGSDGAISSPRQANGSTNIANSEGAVGWTYRGSSVIV